MGVLSGQLGAVGGSLGKASPFLGKMQQGVGAGKMQLGGLPPGQAQLPAGAGGGVPTPMAGAAGSATGAEAPGAAGGPWKAPTSPMGGAAGAGAGSIGGSIGGAQPPGGAQQLPGMAVDPQQQRLTGMAAMGRIAQNPRLQRYFGGGAAPATGMQSPWMAAAPTTRGAGGATRGALSSVPWSDTGHMDSTLRFGSNPSKAG